VWLYFRFSIRDVEELMAARVIDVSYAASQKDQPVEPEKIVADGLASY